MMGSVWQPQIEPGGGQGINYKRGNKMSDRMLTRKAVVEATGRSATSLWRDVNAGIFPAPRQIGPKRIGWLASEVEAWLKSRPVVRTRVCQECNHETRSS